MYNTNSNGNDAASARGFMALCAIMLAMGLALMASPAEAAPFAYVTNTFSNSVSVIDTATNTVVATVALPATSHPLGVAVTPDGKHAYVANQDNPGTVSVIETTGNTVMTTVSLGTITPYGVAVTPDGKRAYVANAPATFR